MMVTVNITEADLIDLAESKIKKEVPNALTFNATVKVPMMLEGLYDKEITVEFDREDDE